MSLKSAGLVWRTVVDDFGLGLIEGLTESEAQRRLKTDGYNVLPGDPHRSFLTHVLRVTKEPMFILLLVAGSIYLLLGDLTEGLMLLGFVIFVV